MQRHPRSIPILAVLGLGLFFIPAHAQEPDEKVGGLSAPGEEPNPLTPLGGDAIVIQDDWWTPALQDEPELKLEAALTEIDAHHHQRAGGELRKAAAYLHIASARAMGDVHRDLEKAAVELADLADRVEKGRAVDTDKLRNIFARDLMLLATQHAEQAALLWDQKRAAKAGHDLRAAGQDFSHALAWAGEKPDDPTTRLLVDADTAAAALIEETGYPAEDVTRILTELQDRIDVLHTALETTG